MPDRLRLILVDDDAERAAAVKTSLQQSGFNVLAVLPTASGLLYQMAQQNPDVVIIALDSPDRDVLESLSIASSHNPRPIVMFSDSGDQSFIAEAIRAGVTAYQVEDINPARAKAAIDVALAQFSAFNNLQQELDKTRRELAGRKSVDRAKGLLMANHKLSEEKAYNTLRKLAMDSNSSLADTADKLITMLEKAGHPGGTP